MDKRDADNQAESDTLSKAAAGSRESLERERQTSTAGKESSSSETMELMEQVVERENLKQALKRVLTNKGAAGIDGMTVEELTPHLKEHWPRLRRELMESRYVPEPVRGVDTPKTGGGTRRLGIPTVLDRFIQQAVLQVLTPIFDPGFSESSYGYRPGRSAQQAVEAGRKHVAEGFRWVVDLDIEKFFDRVNHDVLMARVARRVKDKRLLKLIRAYLNAGIMVDGVVQPRDEGTPQGGPLSPLLSNVLLDELDKELERRGHRFCRYADDCNVYVRSKAAGERVMASLETFLSKRLRLKVNRDKSAVDRPWKRSFLGYSMTAHPEPKLKVSPKSVKRAKANLRELFREGRGLSLKQVILEVNQFTRGWGAYYRLARTQNVFKELDQWIRRRCRWLLWRHWKRPWTRAKNMIGLGLDRNSAWMAAKNGLGPWRNAGASHMNASVRTPWLAAQGLLSLHAQHRRLATAV